MPRNLAGICLITEHVLRLGRFYEMVLQVEGKGDEGFYSFDRVAGFAGDGVTLAIFSVEGMEQMAPRSLAGSGSGRTALEFRVEDVDAEYSRLLALDVEIVKPPTTQPWGLRSVWFRDLDGNIVNFFASVEN